MQKHAAWSAMVFLSMGCFLATIAQSAPQDGTLLWAKRAGGIDTTAPKSIATLSDGSYVVVGLFNGTTTFGPGEVNETILVSNGNYDIFLARYNADGDLIWAKGIGSDGLDGAFVVSALTDGDFAVGGYFQGTVTFDPENEQATLVAQGARDGFLAVYHPDGTLVWVKAITGTGAEGVTGVAEVAGDGIVVAGVFGDTMTFDAGGENETTVTSVGGNDIFLARYGLDGSFAWATRAGGTGEDIANRLAALTNGDVVVTGAFQEMAVFGKDEPQQTALASAGQNDIFVACYSAADGLLRWAKSAGGEYSDVAFGIAGLTNGSCVIAGYIGPLAAFAPGVVLQQYSDYDAVFACYGADGSFQWAKQAGGPGTDVAFGVAALPNGDWVATGYFAYSAVFGEGDTNKTTLTSAGKDDTFVAHYDAQGRVVWAKRAGGSENVHGSAIADGGGNTCVVAGAFVGQATFGPGQPNKTVLESASSDVNKANAFVARYDAVATAFVPRLFVRSFQIQPNPRRPEKGNVKLQAQLTCVESLLDLGQSPLVVTISNPAPVPSDSIVSRQAAGRQWSIQLVPGRRAGTYAYRGPAASDTVRRASIQFDSGGKSQARLSLQIQGDMTNVLDVTKPVKISLSNNGVSFASTIGLIPGRNDSGKYRAGGTSYDTRLTISRATLRRDRRGEADADIFMLQGIINGFPWNALDGRWPLTVRVEMEFLGVEAQIPQSAYDTRRGVTYRSRTSKMRTFILRRNGRFQIQGQRLTLGDVANPVTIHLQIKGTGGGILLDDTVTLTMQYRRGNWRY